ncbi:FecR family protein [Confluentibacter sediminis]|uniref:FecR family protein n=1 Tax=Confluentibacter sediminis TaxID=2219045 RepID=UPI000DAB801D|nr:FecR family protein [Confluentibacter sediminis]
MKKIIIKYLNDSLTDNEYQELLLWLRKPKNKKKFATFVEENYHLNMSYEEIDDDKALNKVKMSIVKHKKASRYSIWKYAVAAAVAILFAFGYLFNDSKMLLDNKPVIVNNQIKTGIHKATLTLEDGSQVVLGKGTDYKSQNVQSNGEALMYVTGQTENAHVSFNTLTVPRGGQFQIALADGTQVWLNSESQLKYPITFIDGESRNVELIYGEAYFDVSHSTEHGGSNFKVIHNQQEIQVLGTKFNIKAYKDEASIYTTLVEGKVAISTPSERKILLPNQQAILSNVNNKIVVSDIKVKDEIAWVNGEFIIKHKSLKTIMKELSRWYDMDVVFKEKSLEDVKFVGVLGREQDIVQILNTIKELGVINGYEITNKQVILK